MFDSSPASGNLCWLVSTAHVKIMNEYKDPMNKLTQPNQDLELSTEAGLCTKKFEP